MRQAGEFLIRGSRLLKSRFRDCLLSSVDLQEGYFRSKASCIHMICRLQFLFVSLEWENSRDIQ